MKNAHSDDWIKAVVERHTSKRLGKVIRQARHRSNMSLRELSRQAGRMSKSTICRIELGQRKKRLSYGEFSHLMVYSDASPSVYLYRLAYGDLNI